MSTVPDQTITDEQFAALAVLLRLRSGPAEQAAFLVLVDGRSVGDAARECGLTYKAAHQAVKRAREGLALARTAAGLPPADAPQWTPEELAEVAARPAQPAKFNQIKAKASRNFDATWGARAADWEAAQRAENERASRLLDQLIHKPTSGT